MRVVVKPVQELLDAFVNERVMRDVLVPIPELCRRGQLPVKQQIRRFQVRGLFRKFLDGISAIPQNAGVAVDIRDAADARSSVVVRGIVADHAEVGGIHPQLPKVHGANRAVRDGHFVDFPGAIIGDG